MDHAEIMHWLRCEDPRELWNLYERADQVRRDQVGEAVYLRGLVEISNRCARNCHYCGLRAANTRVERYRMHEEEILACARQAQTLGYGTLVLQSGEDDGIEAQWLAACLRRIKAETSLALTLSLGERNADDLMLWREAGADRYLLRFETSDVALYRQIHPDRAGRISDRLGLLHQLRALGYETGSGVMVGIPGQRYEVLADDLLLFRELDFDMIGIGPFIVHPDTPLGQGKDATLPPEEQVPTTIEMTCKVVALARLLRPDANIPATTAVAIMGEQQGRELALTRGANVIMPNLTPLRYRRLYAIYPGKSDQIETADQGDTQIRQQIAALRRSVGVGRGGRGEQKGGER